MRTIPASTATTPRRSILPLTPDREMAAMYTLLRTRSTPAQAAEGLRHVVAQMDSLVPVTRVRSLDAVVSNSVAAPRALAILLLAFGGLAVFIGAIGIYSLIACMVSWRVREIGLRLALGAQRWQIVLSIVRQSFFLAVAGCVLGVGGAAGSGQMAAQLPVSMSARSTRSHCSPSRCSCPPWPCGGMDSRAPRRIRRPCDCFARRLITLARPENRVRLRHFAPLRLRTLFSESNRELRR